MQSCFCRNAATRRPSWTTALPNGGPAGCPSSTSHLERGGETMAASPIVRKRLEAQGFCKLNDTEFGELAPWMRWSPAFCTIFMIAGVALESPVVLWSLAATAFVGALLPFHPFDLLYNYGARYL